MHTKEISSTATLAWGPSSGKSTYFVTGTLAGAMDASFSTNAELEVWDLNEKSAEPPVKLGSIPSGSR
jgi:protein transport protein SEC31